MSHEARLTALLQQHSWELPPPAEPKGTYRPVVQTGHLLFTAGHLPIGSDGRVAGGRVGDDLDATAAHAIARQVGLAILSTVRAHLGSLDRVARVIKVFGVINCTPDFTQQPAVLNGCSELFAAVFGPEAGVGVRSAVGAPSLPLGAAVEIEAVFELADD